MQFEVVVRARSARFWESQRPVTSRISKWGTFVFRQYMFDDVSNTSVVGVEVCDARLENTSIQGHYAYSFVLFPSSLFFSVVPLRLLSLVGPVAA